MPQKPNMEKYNRYVQLKGDLKKAMAAGFYYQAIFIEYAIMEDRCWSALEHAGVECLTKTGKDIGIVQKLDRMQKRKEFSDKLSQKYFTGEFFEALRSWIKDRNTYIHKLARETFNPEHLRELAEEGKRLQERLSYCVRRVNEYHDAQKAIDQKANENEKGDSR